MWAYDLSMKFIPQLLTAEKREHHLPAIPYLLERAEADEISLKTL
jgi:hypothetical protein